MRWVLISVALGGCEMVFGLDPPGTGGADAPTPPGADASLACLVDTFDDTILDAQRWRLIDPGSPHLVAPNGFELEIDLESSIDGENGVESLDRYDLTGATAEVLVLEVPDQSGSTETGVVLAGVDGAQYLMRVRGNALVVGRVTLNGPELAPTSWSSSSHRHWRIRHVPGGTPSVAFEAAPDGLNWTTLHELPGGDVGAMRVRIYGLTDGGGLPSPGEARYDDFTLTRASCP